MARSRGLTEVVLEATGWRSESSPVISDVHETGSPREAMDVRKQLAQLDPVTGVKAVLVHAQDLLDENDKVITDLKRSMTGASTSREKLLRITENLEAIRGMYDKILEEPEDETS